MKLRFKTGKEFRKEIIGTLLLLSVVSLAWGSLILPNALGLSNRDHTVMEGGLLFFFGVAGFLTSFKWNRRVTETKWYESIRKN
jgi:hypothetical protein